MGKGGICIHYTLLVVSEGVKVGKGPWSSGLSFFLFPFRLVFLCLGGLLGERIRMSVSTPFCPSWDTILSLNPTSAYRGTDKGPRNEWLYVSVRAGVCVCVRRLQNVCVCVCHWSGDKYVAVSPSEELVSSRGKIRGRDMRRKTQTDSCPLWLFSKLQFGLCGWVKFKKIINYVEFNESKIGFHS